MSLSGKPPVGGSTAEQGGAEPQCWPSAPADNPLGSTRGIEELRGSRDLVNKDAMLLIPVPEIKV